MRWILLKCVIKTSQLLCTQVLLQRWLGCKESPCQSRRCKRCGFDTWRRKWQPTPAFFPGKSHGQRSLVDYGPWRHRVGHDWVTKHAQLDLVKTCETIITLVPKTRTLLLEHPKSNAHFHENSWEILPFYLLLNRLIYFFLHFTIVIVVKKYSSLSVRKV